MSDQTWRVIAKNGILVREGQDLKSAEAASRLSKGAIVRECELNGERLRYELLSGDGPQTGWVSLTAKGSELLLKHGKVPKQVDLGISALPAPAGAKGCCIWMLSFESNSRDEVQAFVAVGATAKKAGYRVRLFAPAKWQALASAVGIELAEGGLPEQEEQASFLHLAQAAAAQATASPPDLVLYSPTCMSIAVALYDAIGVTTYPVWFRLPDPNWIMPKLFWLEESMMATVLYSPLGVIGPDEISARILAPKVLLATTSLELEAIADPTSKQQYNFTHKPLFTGKWTIPEPAQASLGDALLHGVRGDIEAFLKAGKPPVYVGWGGAQVEGNWACGTILSAVKACGLRAIVVSGKSTLNEDALRSFVGDDPEGLLSYAKANVLFTPAVPLETVLPKCCCAMLHGGHGTVGSCLHAALPMLISPMGDDDHHYADWIVSLGMGKKTPDIWSLEASVLKDMLKSVATDAALRGKAQEVQKTVSGELGVTAALLGINGIMKNEVVSGATKRAWQEKKRIEEEAAETDEEPLDGVLRPPSDIPPKKPVAIQAPTAKPAWLKPDGKGKILIFTIPLKGHIIHLIRIAQWFLEHPGYEVTVVCSDKSAPDIPKGASIITYKHTDMFNKVDELLAKQAHLDEDEQPAEAEKPSVTATEDSMDLLKKIIAPVVEWKPDVFITDEGLNFVPAENFIPALCKVYKAKCIYVVSPSIKENRVRQYKAQVKLAKKSDKKPLKSLGKPEDTVDAEEVKKDIFKPDENGMPNIPFRPESMSMMKLMQVFRAMPTVSAEPPIKIYPSSHVLYKANRYDNELFAGSFGTLPRPVNGAVQHGRADLEGTMKPELLDWLFASEDPVVYVAYGTIVSKFLPGAFVSRVVEALDGGSWRVIMVVPDFLQKHVPSGLPPDRWRIESFAPQADILRCERTRCFISHCGANSTMEAMACGVPLVCMPFYMDQFDWSWAARRHCRAAVQLSCHSEASEIRTAVSEVLTDTAYRENAHKVALRMAEQADTLLDKFGEAMKPKARLGPGVTVLAAIIVGLMKGEDVTPIFKLVDESLPP